MVFILIYYLDLTIYIHPVFITKFMYRALLTTSVYGTLTSLYMIVVNEVGIGGLPFGFDHARLVVFIVAING
jgi:hypothetical protein